ncbi:putative transcriptional regulator cudA [Balamuthia mandrillaris]
MQQPISATTTHSASEKMDLERKTTTTTTAARPTVPAPQTQPKQTTASAPSTSATTKAASTAPYRLVVRRQGSLEQDKIYKNGVKKNVHAVIKNNPFEMELGLEGQIPADVNFHRFTVKASLLYDTNSAAEKMVDFIKSPPMEYDCKVSNNGQSVLVDMKLSVLSSQHEDMFFLVKFRPTTSTGSPLELPAPVYSEPIKVVSKPAQLKRNRTAVAKGAKRTFNDTLKESLSRIEAQQKEQQELMGTILRTLASASGAAALAQAPQVKAEQEEETAAPAEQRAQKRQRTEEQETDKAKEPAEKKGLSAQARFTKHLHGLVEAYNNMAAEERPETVRKVVRTIPSDIAGKLPEVIDRLWSEGLQREVGRNVATGSPYSGLNNFEDFYNRPAGSEDLFSVLNHHHLRSSQELLPSSTTQTTSATTETESPAEPNFEELFAMFLPSSTSNEAASNHNPQQHNNHNNHFVSSPRRLSPRSDYYYRSPSLSRSNSGSFSRLWSLPGGAPRLSFTGSSNNVNGASSSSGAPPVTATPITLTTPMNNSSAPPASSEQRGNGNLPRLLPVKQEKSG